MPLFKKISSNIQQLIIDNPETENKKLTWINVVSPGKKEIEYLRKKYNFSLEYLRASSAKATAQRPSISMGENYIFLILHFPVLRNGGIRSEEVDFFIGHGFLITLHNNEIKALGSFFNHCKKDVKELIAYQFESSAILLYELLNQLLCSRYKILDEVSLMISEAEEMIFAQRQKESVENILQLRRNNINARRIMQNHKNILKNLMEVESSIVPQQKLKSYYRPLIEHSKRVWEIIENQKEMIDALHDTNESLLNYRISDIMKTLTIFSVIVFPLTLLAAIFGMNVIEGMPFMDTPNGFWIIIGIMLAGCLGMIIFFEKKKWL